MTPRFTLQTTTTIKGYPMTFMTIFLQMLTLCIPIVGGIVAARAGFLDQKMNTALTRLVMNITLPCMVVASVGANETLPKTPVLLTLLAASTAGYAIAAIIAFAITALMRTPATERSAWHFSITFGNVGFIGYPALSAIFGPQAVLYAAIANIPFNLFNFSIGAAMVKAGAQGTQEQRALSLGKRLRELARDAANPTFFASFILLALVLLGIHDLGILGDGLTTIGNFTTPAVLLMLGSTLASYNAREMLGNWRAYVAGAARLILVPCAILLILGGFVTDPLAQGVLVVGSAMPAASNGVLFSLLYGVDPKPMMQANFVTIVASILTIPLIALMV